MRQSLPVQRSLAFVIHDLNAWGGQDRSTLEIARRLSAHLPVEVHAFTLDPPAGDDVSKLLLVRIRPNLRRPVLLKTLYFYGLTLFTTLVKPAFAGRLRPLVHATGACSLISDIVQVQFVHSAWREIAPSKNGSFVHRCYHELLQRFDCFMERTVYTPDKRYIAISHSVAQDLKEYFGITANVKVIHHGVDSSKFSPATASDEAKRKGLRASLGVSDREVMALFVGSYERKGLRTVIESLSKLSADNVKLVAVGGGDADFFKAFAKSLGVENKVVLIPHSKNIVPYFQAADLFVFPTLYEPFGMVVLEAMSCGLPCVVSQRAGASELIDNGTSGLLIYDPLNAVELAESLSRLTKDQDLRQEMGRNARKVAVNRSWDRVAQDYLQLIEPILSADESGNS